VGPWFAPRGRCAVTSLGRRRRADRSGVAARGPAGGPATPRRNAALGSASGPRSIRARADMGRATGSGADLAHRSRRPNLGRRADRASGGTQRPVMGPVGRRGSAGPDLGLARARAIPVSAAARAVMGRQQTGHPGRVNTGAVVGFPWQRLQATRLRLGRARACFVGCPWDVGAERSTGRGALLERTGRARVGCHEDPGARRACDTVVVGPIGGTGAAGRTTTAGPNGAHAATAPGGGSSVVAPGRVSGSAAVPRASDGRLARHRRRAAR
jgi:hypothetical protein